VQVMILQYCPKYSLSLCVADVRALHVIIFLGMVNSFSMDYNNQRAAAGRAGCGGQWSSWARQATSAGEHWGWRHPPGSRSRPQATGAGAAPTAARGTPGCGPSMHVSEQGRAQARAAPATRRLGRSHMPKSGTCPPPAAGAKDRAQELRHSFSWRAKLSIRKYGTL
jgi:hypothetical protein